MPSARRVSQSSYVPAVLRNSIAPLWRGRSTVRSVGLTLGFALVLSLSLNMGGLPASASEFSPAGCAAFARNQQWKELADYTERWTKAEPGNAEAWYSLGNAYGSSEHKFGLQQPEKAVEAYRQAVKLNPRSAKTWNALGHSTFESGNREEALQAFKKATELEPNNARYWNSLGSVHGMGTNPNDAAATAAYKRAERLGSKDAVRNNAIIHAPVQVTNNGWNFAPARGGFKVDPYFLHQNPTTGAPLLNPTTGQRMYPY